MYNNTLVYFHGLGSSGNSTTVSRLRLLMPELEILAPDIPLSPAEALPYLRRYCLDTKPALVMGTSMGGMYAQQIRGIAKLIINPAFHVSKVLDKMIGVTLPYYTARQDGNSTYTVTLGLVDEFRQMEARQWDNITPFDVAHTIALFGTRDDIVDCRDEYMARYMSMRLIDCGHRIEPTILADIIVPLIRDIIEAPC